MDWMLILSQIFEIVILPLLGIGTAYVIALVRAKIQEMKENKEDVLYHKYLDMLNDTIADCVLATTQTYVEALKKEGKFDLDAQKIAFTRTYENVMAILADEAKEYLQTAIGDLSAYVENMIEAEVNRNK
jgi:hypothetical protein